MGTDVALLANNHCCDRRARGIRSTIATLNNLGVAHTGAFADEDDYRANRILRLERNGIRFAIVNYTYGTNGIPTPQGCVVNLIDTMRMAVDLAQARVGADCVVACMHWGEEYRRQPSREQRSLAEFLHRQGVDVVIGSHPHVVQPAMADSNSVTVYSLGNLVSNQRKRYCDGGIVAEVEVVKMADGKCHYSLCITPVWVALPGYRILPPELASNGIFNDQQKSAYEQFMYDTEQLFVRGLR
jgi:poly-gamma-glutamate synthesis protein (capsule biosynthesis protein)